MYNLEIALFSRVKVTIRGMWPVSQRRYIPYILRFDLNQLSKPYNWKAKNEFQEHILKKSILGLEFGFDPRQRPTQTGLGIILVNVLEQQKMA